MANNHMDTALFDKAAQLAIKAHANTERRGKGFPYIIHCMEAAQIVSTLTSDQEILAAAMLHDTVEDTDVTLEQIRSEFGEKVASLVAADSDDTSQKSWRKRKEAAIRRVARASQEGKIVAMGDKLSNMRAIWRDYKVKGDELWKLFHADGKGDHEWHYRSLAHSLSSLKGTDAYDEFVRLIDDVFPETSPSAAVLVDMDDYEQSGDGFTAVSYNKKSGDTMMKLYAPFITPDIPAKEINNTRNISRLGIRVPQAYSLVTDGERLGVEFERIRPKKSFARAISDDPSQADFYAGQMAGETRKLHSTPCDRSKFGNVADFFRETVSVSKFLDDRRRKWFLDFIDSVPVADTCIHGDLHIGNILTNGRENVWIDIADFRYGNPKFDLGMYCFVSLCIPEELVKKLYHIDKPLMTRVWRTFLSAYYNVRDEAKLLRIEESIKPFAALYMIHFSNRQDVLEPFMVPFLDSVTAESACNGQD